MAKVTPSKIVQAYIDYLLEEGHQPSSVYQFAKSIKIKEEEFYDHFSSFEAIESGWMATLFESVTEELANDEVFQAYSAREKYMAFLYAWVEKCRSNRSFLLLLSASSKMPNPLPTGFSSIKKHFRDFADSIVREGLDTQEVKQRPILSDRYADAMFLQFAFVHSFWLKDSSKGFEKTDAAIEKSVHLAFDLMGQSAFDSALEFGKFLFQQKGA